MDKQKRLGILTSGGDCPGLNAVIRAIVNHATLTYRLAGIGNSLRHSGVAGEKGHALGNARHGLAGD